VARDREHLSVSVSSGLAKNGEPETEISFQSQSHLVLPFPLLLDCRSAAHRDKSREGGRLKAKVEHLLTLGTGGKRRARTCFQPEGDGFAPHTQDINLRHTHDVNLKTVSAIVKLIIVSILAAAQRHLE